MAALSFATSSKRAKRKSSPSLTTIFMVAALAGGAAYLFMPSGVSLAAIPNLDAMPSLSDLRDRVGLHDAPILRDLPDAPKGAPKEKPVLAAAPAAHTSADPAPPTIAGVASVIDADTLEIHGERVRLDGVDAPESHQQCKDADGKFWRCGQTAANALDAWIAGAPLSCKTHGREKWGRLLATCTVRGASVQNWLVSHGYALAYRQYSTAYVAAEDKAHEKKVGVWAGEFVNPSDWRKGLRMEGEKPTKAMLEGKFAAK
jgi:endonuclease YncB( thermonuclease family)